jgi:16S rRNA (guanine(966)-N(2))-methyltransferase RsmD
MRIITGSAKGTKLKSPNGMETRPTADRVKESLFNIMGNILVDADVLDLFAGTGNLGLEAVSRGASCAVFIDKSPNSIETIRVNALQTKLIDKTEIYKNDVFKGLTKLDQLQRTFDLIFCDPPYNKGFINRVLAQIDKSNLLKSEGILVIEHSQHEEMKQEWENLQMRRREKYGETLISFWCRIR